MLTSSRLNATNMKTRQGFVSNSSSSSFIIAVPNKAKTCKCCKRSNHWLLQAIGKYLGSFSKDGNKFYPITSAENIVDHYKTDLEELIASKKYAENQLKIITDLQKDPTVFANYERLKRQLDLFRSKLRIEDEAQYCGGFDPEKNLKDRQERLEKHLVDYDKKVKEIEDIIAKVSKFLKKDYTVYSFTIDNWSTDAEKSIMDMMKEPDLIEVIWSTRT